tara:strand:- start:386 stop:1264 length:879 start_codon:yes stop_codon:yes gene_type:complete
MKNKVLKYIKELEYEYKLSGINVPISDISLIHFARENDLCYLDANVPRLVKDKQNITLICPFDFDESNTNISYIKVKDPKLVFYYVSHLFGDNKTFKIDKELSKKYPGATIGINCKIGNNVAIQPGVIIRSNTIIGNNTTIESGSVIGSTGLLWTWDKDKKVMLTLTGGTEIGKNCYICCNVSIVRGSCNEMTYIGDGTMIAPGSAIGHGCIIGKNTHIANNVTLSGAVTIGENCFFGSGCTVQPAIKILNNTVLGSGAILTKDTEKSGVYVGIPAKWIKERNNNLKGLPKK